MSFQFLPYLLLKNYLLLCPPSWFSLLRESWRPLCLSRLSLCPWLGCIPMLHRTQPAQSVLSNTWWFGSCISVLSPLVCETGKALEGSYLDIPPLPRRVQISIICAVIYSSLQSWKCITARTGLPSSHPIFQLLALLVFLTQVLSVEFSVLSWTAIAPFLEQLIKLSF